jgi:hypothetical protein
MGILYIPSYQIEVELDGESRMYIGYLDGDFKNVSMNEVLAKFWNSSVFEFFMTLNWGGYFKNNLEVCEFIGLDYKTMLIKKKDESIQFFNYKNYRFIESNHFDYLDNTFRMLTENELLVPGILSFFDSHNAGNGIWEV